MAEKGAHLTGTTFLRPSIFEIIAQESLASLSEPAFKKILWFFVTCNYERYGHILKWSDEAFLIFNFVLQKHYLSKYTATFSETFYGLKRTVITNTLSIEELSHKKKRLSLLLVVLFPYLKQKLHQLSQRYQIEKADGIFPKEKWKKCLRTCVIHGYTIGFIIYETFVLFHYISYVSGNSMFPSPLLKLLSIGLVYAKPQDAITFADLLRKIRNRTFNITDGFNILEGTVTRSLELSAFILQFIRWWNQENYNSNIISLPVPPPPKLPESNNQLKGICPICKNRRKIHTALAISGYVFCYKCILPIVRTTKKCPITKYPCTEDDLIRLYVE